MYVALIARLIFSENICIAVNFDLSDSIRYVAFDWTVNVTATYGIKKFYEPKTTNWKFVFPFPEAKFSFY